MGCDLVILLIREGFVGGIGGREKTFVSEMQIEKYEMYMGFIMFAGAIFGH